MDAITFQKLRDVEARLGQVQARMSDQEVATDPTAYQRLAKESNGLAPVVERYRAYKDVLAELTKVQEMIKVEADAELREMAHEELHALEAKRDALEAEIPLLLIPKDPNDEKNVAARDPGRHGRRGGGAVRGRDVPHVHRASPSARAGRST